MSMWSPTSPVFTTHQRTPHQWLATLHFHLEVKKRKPYSPPPWGGDMGFWTGT